MFGLGTTELLVIAFVVVLLFGGRKLPQLGRSMGMAITNFKNGLNAPSEGEQEKEEKNKTES